MYSELQVKKRGRVCWQTGSWLAGLQSGAYSLIQLCRKSLQWSWNVSSRPHSSGLATSLERAKAFWGLQDLGRSESDSEVMLEELYQDFLVSVTQMLTPLKLLQSGTQAASCAHMDGRQLLLLMVEFGKRGRKIHKIVSRLFTTLVLAVLDLLGSHWKRICSCLSPSPLPQPPSALLFRSPPHCFHSGTKPPLKGWSQVFPPQGYVRVPSLSCYLNRSALHLPPAPRLTNQRQTLLNGMGIPQAAVVTTNACFVMELITRCLP